MISSTKEKTFNLNPTPDRNWVSGLSQVFQRENLRWWASRRWFVQAVFWLLAIDGILAYFLFVMPNMIPDSGELPPILEIGIEWIFNLGGIGTAVGVVILCHDNLLGDKLNGTAEWVLSKPVSRTGFLLGKFFADLLAMLVLLVSFPTAVAYGLIWVSQGNSIPIPAYLQAVGLLGVHSVFYLTLVYFLSVVSNNRMVILGISLGSILGGVILVSSIPFLSLVTPWMLPSISKLYAAPIPLPAGLMPGWIVGITVVWILALLGASIWKFGQYEF